jgi:hypothetical protein
MTFAVYESIVMNATYVGREAGRPSGQIQGYRVYLVIEDAPEGTSREDVVQKGAVQSLLTAGEIKRENAEIRSESEWPEEVRRQVYSRQFDADMRRSWAGL